MRNTKTFFDNEATLRLDDKSFVLTKGMGEDYKANYSALIDTLKADLIRPLLKSMIGRLHINNLNRMRDSKKWSDEYFEYLLLDGRELDIADYPELAGSLGIVHRSGKFVLPNFRDGTLRNIEAGSGRALGSFQEDAMESHTHGNTHSHVMNAHSHPINDIRGGFGMGLGGIGRQLEYSHLWGGGSFKQEDGVGNSYVPTWTSSGDLYPAGYYSFSSHRAGINATNNATSTMQNTTIRTDNGTGRQGEETRMKNVGVQFYIMAKVLI